MVLAADVSLHILNNTLHEVIKMQDKAQKPINNLYDEHCDSEVLGPSNDELDQIEKESRQKELKKENTPFEILVQRKFGEFKELRAVAENCGQRERVRNIDSIKSAVSDYMDKRKEALENGRNSEAKKYTRLIKKQFALKI